MKCATKHCRNPRRKQRRRCHKCERRAWRAANRLRAAFCTLRDHARARGIEFAIDFADFARFANETAYLEHTGPFALCLTIDRIDNLQGYTLSNIQPLTREANSRKLCQRDEIRHKAGQAWRR